MPEIRTLPLLDCPGLTALLDGGTFAEGTFAWFRTLAETTLGPDEKAIVTAAFDDEGKIRAALPLAAHKTGALRALTAPYTTRYAPALGDTDWSRLLGARARAYVANVLRLDALDIADPGVAAFLQGLASTKLMTAQFTHFVNWNAHIAQFDNFWSERPGRLRSTVERKLSSLAKGHVLNFEWDTDAGMTDRLLTAYDEVYKSSWKPAEPHPDFIATMVRNLRPGQLVRQGTLSIDAKVAAAQIWLVKANKATIFKLAHREDMARFSPGTLLSHWMLARLCREENIRDIDFGRGDDGYKKDWLPGRGMRYGFIAANWKSSAGFAALIREILPTQLSKFARAAAKSAGPAAG